MSSGWGAAERRVGGDTLPDGDQIDENPINSAKLTVAAHNELYEVLP